LRKAADIGFTFLTLIFEDVHVFIELDDRYNEDLNFFYFTLFDYPFSTEELIYNFLIQYTLKSVKSSIMMLLASIIRG